MFDNKHIFIVSGSDNFINVYLDTLTYRSKVDPDKICVITIEGSKHKRKKETLIPGVRYFDYDSDMAKKIVSASSITFMSVSSKNSRVIREVIDAAPSMNEKIYIFLTDDEVARWYISYHKYGKIKPSPKLYITEDDIYVLGKLKYFIKHEKAFRDRVAKVLKREDIEFINVDGCFGTLLSQESDALEKIIKIENSWSGKEKKILIGTKQKAFSLKQIKSIIGAFANQNMAETYKFVIIWHKKHRKQRIMLDLYITWLRHFKRQTIDINYVTQMSPVAYVALVMSCSHVILQPRGGVTSAKQFMRWGQGIVCVPSGSSNSIGPNAAYGVDLIQFNSAKDLVSKIQNNTIDIAKNERLIKEEEVRCWKVLGELYS